MVHNGISLIPAEPKSHFAAIASLMNTQETEPNTAESLSEWYSKKVEDGIQFTAAVSDKGTLCGFSGIYRGNNNLESDFGIYLIVAENQRRQGLGTRLYQQLEAQANRLHARVLRARVRDTCKPGIQFALHRGFVEKKHSIEMVLDLTRWDDRPSASILEKLQAQGFHFTDMAELGDAQEARRRLYALNNATAATDPGSDGIPPWINFEQFEKDVCNSSWYHPEGQIVAIDILNGEWAAMSAITVFKAADHAFNLFTGTDVRYRGRKLAQAVKSLALRKARTYGVDKVRTSHNSENVAMISIDTKLGYMRTPGTILMLKDL